LTAFVETAKNPPVIVKASLAAVAILASTGCDRSQSVPDRELGGLVVARKAVPDPIDVDRAAKEPAELGRALAMPHHVASAALGLHVITITTSTVVDEAGRPVSSLDDKTTIELGEHGAYHGVYTNSADYGREVVWSGGALFLRPRYQRWHQRTPEAPDEPDRLRDEMVQPIAATWELVAPGVELTDRGPAQVAGHAGRKIEVTRAPSPRAPDPEPLAQRKWREHRSIDAVAGEVVIDADHGVPLSVKLEGTIGFTRDGRKFVMKVKLHSEVSGIGTAVAIAVPAGDDVVATPEREREVDARDFLLQGIAPPLKKAPDGAAPATLPRPPAMAPGDKP
jgi:hypothetical protein